MEDLQIESQRERETRAKRPFARTTGVSCLRHKSATIKICISRLVTVSQKERLFVSRSLLALLVPFVSPLPLAVWPQTESQEIKNQFGPTSPVHLARRWLESVSLANWLHFGCSSGRANWPKSLCVAWRNFPDRILIVSSQFVPPSWTEEEEEEEERARQKQISAKLTRICADVLKIKVLIRFGPFSLNFFLPLSSGHFLALALTLGAEPNRRVKEQ